MFIDLHNSLPLDPMPSKVIPLHNLTFYCLKIYFNIILPSMSRCSKLPPSFRFLQQTPTHTCHMPCPSHPPPLDRHNNSGTKTTSSNKPQITDWLLYCSESGLFAFNCSLHKVIQMHSQYWLLTGPTVPSKIPNWRPSPSAITYGHFRTEKNIMFSSLKDFARQGV